MLKFTEVCEAYDILSNGNLAREPYNIAFQRLQRRYMINTASTFCAMASATRKEFKLEVTTSRATTSKSLRHSLVPRTPSGPTSSVSLRFSIALVANVQLHQNEHVIVTVNCTLMELYNGSTKIITFERTILNADGRSTHAEQVVKEIQIRPGSGRKSDLVFKGEGNQGAGSNGMWANTHHLLRGPYSKNPRNQALALQAAWQ